MTDYRLTEERLKSHLDGRQPDRERMCISLLRLNKLYTNISSARPDGGPDHGRDLECLYNGEICFGAVGFMNHANDSSQQVRSIKKKFKKDLDSALEAEPRLRAFVFFTNIDLTQSNRNDLLNYASEKGMNHVDILYRDRMRLLLDSPEGYSIRLSFLDIPLSDAEQKDFFSRFGTEIQDLIVGRLLTVEYRLEELEFRNWLRSSCFSINVKVNLKSYYRVDGHNHEPYRFALRLARIRMFGEGEFWIGCYSLLSTFEDRTDFWPFAYGYADTPVFPDNRKHISMFNSGPRIGAQPFHSIEFGLNVEPGSPFELKDGIRLAELKQYTLGFYCDSEWDDRIENVEVWFDDYLVFQFKQSYRGGRVKERIPFWPEEAVNLELRPVTFWHGSLFRLRDLPRRKRVQNSLQP